MKNWVKDNRLYIWAYLDLFYSFLIGRWQGDSDRVMVELEHFDSCFKLIDSTSKIASTNNNEGKINS